MVVDISALIPDGLIMPGAPVRIAMPGCRVRPSYYSKRCSSTVSCSRPISLSRWVEVFGADHVLAGTDYPYDMAESDPLGHLASR